MRKTLSIFSILLLLSSCIAPQRGSGIVGKIDIAQPDPNKATLYIKYSSMAGAYTFVPNIVINNNNINQNIFLGDNESGVVKIDEGTVRITVYPPLDKILAFWQGTKNRGLGTNQEREKILTKSNVKKNNNYFFIIRPDISYPFSDNLAGKAVTYNYEIYETEQVSFLDFQATKTIGWVGNKVPNIHGFTEDILDKETLLQIASAEKEFENKEVLKLKITIKKAEDDCLKKGVTKSSANFNECTFETWKNVYGKQYMDYKKDTVIEYKLIERQVYASGDKNLQSMFNSGQNSLEMSDTASDIIEFALTVVASYYLGKAIGSTLKQPPPKAANISQSKDSGFRYVCFINQGSVCAAGSGYGFVR
jgi:hypothetical protein